MFKNKSILFALIISLTSLFCLLVSLPFILVETGVYVYAIFFSVFLFLLSFFVIRYYLRLKFDKLYYSINKSYNNHNNNDFKKAEKAVEVWVKDKEIEIQQLKSHEKFRKEFIGNLAHELKTPLATIDLSIENLKLGAYTRNDSQINQDIEMVFHYFPRLKERTGLAGYLSGGEQQMLAIGRALMARPKMICLDEPSMGLSPLLVKEVFGIINKINKDQGITMLLVEQNANYAIKAADYGYIMESGKIVLDGTQEQLLSNEDVKEFYLGGGNEERKSFKNLKSYKRRKRWL